MSYPKIEEDNKLNKTSSMMVENPIKYDAPNNNNNNKSSGQMIEQTKRMFKGKYYNCSDVDHKTLNNQVLNKNKERNHINMLKQLKRLKICVL